MAENETSPSDDGARYLELLDLGHLSEQEITTEDGKKMLAKEFLIICGAKAMPFLRVLDKMDKGDPRYEPFKGGLRNEVLKRVLGEAQS